MARLLYFALGAAVGLAYASQLIDKERLNLAPSEAERALREAELAAQGPKPDFKTRIADTIDLQADRLPDMIDERVAMWTERLHVAGHRMAAKLRGEPDEFEAGLPGRVLIYGEAYSIPLDDMPADQADTGFEANR